MLEILPIFLAFFAILVSVIGWGVVHHNTLEREIEKNKRDLSTQYLIESYRVLADDIAKRGDLTDARKSAFEKALTDIQLLGSEEQISMANKCAMDIANGRGGDITPLIESLRKDLRKLLCLPPSKEGVKFLRFECNLNKKGAATGR